ncbi:hypothetical protein [Methylovirgula sp. 4M-Z18]|uniref:hypothetical protein n=1 Tax=Methylovirgula sp. 4M-Z18 TaxID=2293567 RepID=UPI000E2F4096|nr:hypothetical protein [Methylovirgula sp. 4M-Z18]RFB75630.1 hypothetical protein DYH55_21525 [Methylovirgula sp. 4M-Z18]
MRLLWTILLALASSAALAASPQDDYIAARDKAIAAIEQLQKSHANQEAVDAADTKALADLRNRLATIVAPFAVAGFPDAGEMNLQTLNPDPGEQGFGMLDGLRHAQSEGRASIVATTRGLVERWLKSKAKALPSNLDQALKLDDFYTSAMSSDATFSGTLDFPLKMPDGADIAIARLGVWAQDIGPWREYELVVTIAKGDSVLIADVPATSSVSKIATCEAIWTSAAATAEKLNKVHVASNIQNKQASEAAEAAENKGDRDYRKCMGEHLPHESVFSALLKQAQDLADLLVAK